MGQHSKLINSTADLEPAPGLAGIRKAVSAGLTAGVTAAGAALTAAAPDGFTVTEWVTVGSAFVVAAVVVGFAAYIPPNDFAPLEVVKAGLPAETGAIMLDDNGQPVNQKGPDRPVVVMADDPPPPLEPYKVIE